MEPVAILFAPAITVFGSGYCVWILWSRWRESRSANLQSQDVRKRSAKHGRSLESIIAVVAELGLAVAFVVGAVLVLSKAAQTQGVNWWQTAEIIMHPDKDLTERLVQGPNDSRLVIHFAGSMRARPVVFVDSTYQPIGDGDLVELARQFPDTRDLMLGCTQVTDVGLSNLQHFHNLDSLSLQRLPITDQGLRNLTGHCDLTFLDLSATSITDEGLKCLIELPRLEELRLSNTRVSDKGLTHLRGHRNLKLLVLYDTVVTQQGITELRKSLPDCEIKRKQHVPHTERGYSFGTAEP